VVVSVKLLILVLGQFSPNKKFDVMKSMKFHYFIPTQIAKNILNLYVIKWALTANVPQHPYYPSLLSVEYIPTSTFESLPKFTK